MKRTLYFVESISMFNIYLKNNFQTYKKVKLILHIDLSFLSAIYLHY